ncbi:MAG: hypothetical protein SGJ23_08555 [Alphaproteobacteria bacterium]|nr:hypothetical protein [Alphaproteobacteria bacterium]
MRARLFALTIAAFASVGFAEAASAQMHSRFAAPAPAAKMRTLAQEEARALSETRAVVAEMRRLALTSEERALAEADGQNVERLAGLIAERGRLRNEMAAARAAGTAGQDQILAATRKMQETQMSFNLQYLQLQSQMQHENRSYTAISNIMKTKHDTVKNSISNVR